MCLLFISYRCSSCALAMLHIDFKFCIQPTYSFECILRIKVTSLSINVLPALWISLDKSKKKKKLLKPHLLNQLTHQPESHFLIATSISSPRQHNHKSFKNHFEAAIFLGLNYRSNFLCSLLCFTRKALRHWIPHVSKEVSSVHSTFYREFGGLSLMHFVLYIPLEILFYPASFPSTSVMLTAFQNFYHIFNTLIKITIHHDPS